jgi:fructose-1,6-bisphosphatase/sedoheptulose 1,7-bisphosphatase-like protein
VAGFFTKHFKMTNTDVVKKLIGDVQPYGAYHIDEKRFENLKAMCELVGDLIEEIKDAAKSKERHEHSMKEMGLYAYNFLTQLETEVGF